MGLVKHRGHFYILCCLKSILYSVGKSQKGMLIRKLAGFLSIVFFIYDEINLLKCSKIRYFSIVEAQKSLY
jgi:hypothetical protein